MTVKTHAFSIELKHKKYLKTIGIPTNGHANVVIEGFLGKLLKAEFVEDSLLEIHGVNGVFRIDMKPQEALQISNIYKGVKRNDE